MPPRSNLAEPTTSRRNRKRKSREVARPFFPVFSALRGKVPARYREGREVGTDTHPLEARKTR